MAKRKRVRGDDERILVSEETQAQESNSFLGCHRWLLWQWLSLKSHCKDLTAFYFPKVDRKNSLYSEKSFLSDVHIHLAKCCYP